MEKFYAQYTAFISECKNKNKAPSVMELMYYILAQDGELRRVFQDMGHNPDETLTFLQSQFKLGKLIIPEELNSIPPIISRLPLQIYTVNFPTRITNHILRLRLRLRCSAKGGYFYPPFVC